VIELRLVAGNDFGARLRPLLIPVLAVRELVEQRILLLRVRRRRGHDQRAQQRKHSKSLPAHTP
jgi:hypothetical protein